MSRHRMRRLWRNSNERGRWFLVGVALVSTAMLLYAVERLGPVTGNAPFNYHFAGGTASDAVQPPLDTVPSMVDIMLRSRLLLLRRSHVYQSLWCPDDPMLNPFIACPDRVWLPDRAPLQIHAHPITATDPASIGVGGEMFVASGKLVQRLCNEDGRAYAPRQRIYHHGWHFISLTAAQITADNSTTTLPDTLLSMEAGNFDYYSASAVTICAGQNCTRHFAGAVEPFCACKHIVNIPTEFVAMVFQDNESMTLFDDGLLASGTFELDFAVIKQLRIFYLVDLLEAFPVQPFVPLADFMDNYEHERFYRHLKHRDRRQDVTLVTQFTANRLRRFRRLTETWRLSPISAVLYLPSPWELVTVLDFICDPVMADTFTRTSLILVKPEYPAVADIHAHQITEWQQRVWCTAPTARYPINRLRNIAVEAAPTDFILTVEADFIPSRDLNSFVRHTVMAIGWNRARLPAGMELGTPWALVIPCFALHQRSRDRAPLYPSELPLTKPSLIESYLSGDVSLTDVWAGHGPTRYPIFFGDHHLQSWTQWGDEESRRFSAWSVAERDDLASQLYENCFETQWEPYYLLPKRTWLSSHYVSRHYSTLAPVLDSTASIVSPRRQRTERRRAVVGGHDVDDSVGSVDTSNNSSEYDDQQWHSGAYLETPLYDERFQNQGGDKQSHSLMLNALGFRFFVSRSHFLLHLDHAHGMPGWPGGLKKEAGKSYEGAAIRRVVSDATCHGNGNNNSADSQTTAATVFSFFDEFLPEMERKFGKGFRLPRGCKATLSPEQNRDLVPLVPGF